MGEKSDLGLDTIAEDYRKEPLSDIPEVEPNAGRKKASFKEKVENKINELKARYRNYESIKREREKESAMKRLERASEEKEVLLIKKQATDAEKKNAELKKAAGQSGFLGAALGQVKQYRESRKGYYQKFGNSKSSNSILSGGMGGGSMLLGKGMGSKSTLLSGGTGGSSLLSGGMGSGSRLLSGGGKGKLGLSLGKGKKLFP